MTRHKGVKLDPISDGRGAVKAFRRSDPPQTREGGYGEWGGPRTAADIAKLQLPGGAFLEFNLSNLTTADYRAMKDHYQISMNLNVLAVSLHQINWRVTGGSTRARNFAEDSLNAIWTELVLAATQAYWCGYSPMILQWENDVPDRRVRLNKVKDAIPEHSAIEWKEVVRNRNVDEGNVNVVHKTKIYNGIRQKGQPGYIPAESTLWYPVLMENGNMYGRQLLKSAFMPWFESQLYHLYQRRYHERFSQPLVVGRAPFDDVREDEHGNQMTGQQVMNNIVTQFRNNSSITLPSERTMNGSGDKHDFEYTLDLLESQMRGADFDRALTRCDEEMSLALFTPILLFRTADVGSYSLGQAHENIFYHMVNLLVEDFARYVNKYLMPRLIGYNFSQEMARTMRFEHRKLGVDKHETLRAMAQAMLNGGLAKPDLRDFGDALGMSWEAIQQVEESGPGAPNAPTSSSSPSENTQREVANLSRKASERILGQLRNSRDPSTEQFEIGFRSKMRKVLESEGHSQELAQRRVDAAYASATEWLQSNIGTAENPESFAMDLELQMMTEMNVALHGS